MVYKKTGSGRKKIESSQLRTRICFLSLHEAGSKPSRRMQIFLGHLVCTSFCLGLGRTVLARMMEVEARMLRNPSTEQNNSWLPVLHD